MTIVTGFLGAGKTTLVRRFLASPEGRDTAVVVNEFGAVGIDDALLRASAEETVLLGNGCLCCSTRSDLQATLVRLIADRDRGTVPFFRRVLIETSGLADPGPILQTFASDRALGGIFHVEVVVTVVDAVNGGGNLQTMAEARKQAILADRLVISKSDLTDPERIDALTARLHALNPRAPVTHAVDGVLDPKSLSEPADADTGPRSTFLAEAEHSDGITSFTWSPPEPVAWAPFGRALDCLIALRGADLLRAKGLLAVTGCRGPVVVQVVQHLAHPPVELEAWPSADHASRIVFITRRIPEDRVRDLFAAVRAVSASGS